MAQVTKAFAEQMLKHGERQEHTPLTINEEQQLARAWLDFNEAMTALEDLSFSCFAGIGLQRPDMGVYKRTFEVLDRLRNQHNGGKAYRQSFS